MVQVILQGIVIGFIPVIIEHIVFVPLESSNNIRNFFLIDAKHNLHHSGMLILD
jgi:hypothetical protein